MNSVVAVTDKQIRICTLKKLLYLYSMTMPRTQIEPSGGNYNQEPQIRERLTTRRPPGLCIDCSLDGIF